MAPLSILVVGSGIAGPTLASFLLSSQQAAREKADITVLERSAALQPYGQNIDIRGTGLTVIRKLGLESAIRSSTTGEEGVQFVDAANRVWAAFGADKSGRIQTGTSDIEILRGRLAELCFQRSRDLSNQVTREGGSGVKYIFGDSLAELAQDEQKVHVRFAKSGERKSYDLVVGADGLQSQTRKLAFGDAAEETTVKPLNMYGGFFSMPKAETDSAWRRWFHAPGRRGVMIRPSGVPDKSTVFLNIISDDDRRLNDVAVPGRKGVEAQKSLLKEYFGDAGWECDRILREMETADDFYYSIVAQIKMDKWSKGRVVLLGDAGYCASPVSGMGTTLALNGAYNLAGALLRHANDHTAAFAEYEQKMRPLVERAQKLAPGMPYLMNPETAWGIWLLNSFTAFMHTSGLANMMFKFLGPPANAMPVEDYGFRQQPEWQRSEA